MTSCRGISVGGMDNPVVSVGVWNVMCFKMKATEYPQSLHKVSKRPFQKQGKILNSGYILLWSFHLSYSLSSAKHTWTNWRRSKYFKMCNLYYLCSCPMGAAVVHTFVTQVLLAKITHLKKKQNIVRSPLSFVAHWKYSCTVNNGLS